MAPEIVQRLPYSKPVDIWSCGVLMFVLLSGKLPFVGSNKRIFELITSGDFSMDGPEWENISEYGNGEVSDFEIITVDIVAQPSAPGAYPTAIYEHLMNSKGGSRAMGLAAEVRNDKKAQKYLQEALTNIIKGLK